MDFRGDKPRFRYRVAHRSEEPEMSFEAAALYCPRCKGAMPVRKKLLLILPQGNLYNLVCANCGESLGKKEE
jgi:hypothetical protein